MSDFNANMHKNNFGWLSDPLWTELGELTDVPTGLKGLLLRERREGKRKRG